MVSSSNSFVNTPAQNSWLNNAVGSVIQEYILHGDHQMGTDLRALLLHIKRRTLDFGKTAERISLRHIKDGLRSMDGVLIAGGLNCGESKARTVLQSAITDGWIIATDCKNAMGGDTSRLLTLNLRRFAQAIGTRMQDYIQFARSGARAVQVSYEVVKEYMTARVRVVRDSLRKRINASFYAIAATEESNTEVRKMHLKMPKRMRQNPPVESEGEGFENHTPKILTNVSSNANIEDTVVSSSRSPSLRGVRIPQPKKPRAIAVDCKSSDTVAEAIAHTGRRAQARTEAAAIDTGFTHKTATQAKTQAVVDSLMRYQYEGRSRALFTIKSFGLLRKQLKANEIEDVRGFLEFAIQNWADIATRHAYGIRRARQDGAKTRATEMPEFPDMWTLATRFSYFLRHYNDNLSGAYRRAVERVSSEKEVGLQKEVARLSKTVQNMTRERAQLLERAARPQRERGPIKPYGYRSHVADDDSHDDDE